MHLFSVFLVRALLCQCPRKMQVASVDVRYSRNSNLLWVRLLAKLTIHTTLWSGQNTKNMRFYYCQANINASLVLQTYNKVRLSGGRFLPFMASIPFHTGVRTGCHCLMSLSVCLSVCLCVQHSCFSLLARAVRASMY